MKVVVREGEVDSALSLSLFQSLGYEVSQKCRVFSLGHVHSGREYE